MSVATEKISEGNVRMPKVFSHVCIHDNQKAAAIPAGQPPILPPDQLPPKTIRLGADRDRVRNQTIRAAEEIISPAPSWLPDVLSELSFELPSAHGIEEIWPTREEMHEELLEIHRLVDLLSERLQNSAVTGFMEANTDADAPAVLSNIAQDHRELCALVQQALKAPQLVGENGELLRGRGKPLLSNTMSPRYICAAIIVEVIDFFYPEQDRLPSQRRSWSAANKLWRTWFKPDPMVSAELTRWKASFKKADDPRLQPLRSYIRRILSSKAALHADLEKK